MISGSGIDARRTSRKRPSGVLGSQFDSRSAAGDALWIRMVSRVRVQNCARPTAAVLPSLDVKNVGICGLEPAVS
jgi:hypothetical protein